MEIKRKLATIRTVKTVEPIEGADSIVKLTFESMGWVCVSDLVSHPIPGQKRVYFEVDSLLPKLPIFDFMEPHKYRVKTIKLRGQVSQGLTISLDDFSKFGITFDTIQEGDDVTDFLSVVKYEIPDVGQQIGGDTKGPFPGFISKTDEERCQNFENIEEILSAHEWDITIKVDGTSGTFYLMNGEFGVCSRNQELKDTEGNVFWKMARKYNLEARMRNISERFESPRNFAIQGEIAGPGIQGNRAKLSEVHLFVFTIQNIDEAKRFTNNEIAHTLARMNDLAEGEKLETVPWLLFLPAMMPKTLTDVAALSEGNCIVTESTREGIVLRAKDDASVSMKFINPKYLLKYDL